VRGEAVLVGGEVVLVGQGAVLVRVQTVFMGGKVVLRVWPAPIWSLAFHMRCVIALPMPTA
jgi:hypothetical protein